METFELKTKIYFGAGERKNLPEYLKANGYKRVGVILDQALTSQEMIQEMLQILEESFDKCVQLVYDFKGEPTYDYLDQIKDRFLADDLDVLIGMGGGSALDVAKGLAVLLTNPVEKAIQYRGFPTGLKAPLPVVTVPTVSGTGSEVTYNAVFIDSGEIRKLGINVIENFPVFALLDPELTLSAPLGVSLSSALDCLVHALESFMSSQKTFVSEMYSKEAFQHIFPGIKGLLQNEKDLEARSEIMKASYLAGIAYFNSSAGPSAALSYPLGTFCRVPHGIAGAFFMQYVLEHNLENGYQGFSELYDRVFSGETGTKTEKEKASIMTQEIVALIDRASVPKKLSEFGATEKEKSLIFDQLKNHLWANVTFNPIAFTETEVDNLLTNIL